MSDNTKLKEHDGNFISLEQAHEIRYWTKELSVSEEILQEAVKAVGNSADAVKKHLIQEGWLDEGWFCE